MRHIAFIFLLLAGCVPVCAQTAADTAAVASRPDADAIDPTFLIGDETPYDDEDSVVVDSVAMTIDGEPIADEPQRRHQWVASHFHNRTVIAGPLIVGGLLFKGHDKKFRNLRNGYLPEYDNGFDNYLQYLPGVVMLGLKAFGVESRSSWGRMIVSDALSVGVMTALVNGVKYTAKVERPDRTSKNSFPSGHTATAFMAATMLTKEYGHLSPWVGFGSYTLAAATGAMRIFNNRHWLSDVMVGAGIGVVATEVGYWLGDLIFKDKGIKRHDSDDKFSRKDRPSFIGLTVGYDCHLNDYVPGTEQVLPMKSGSSASLQGAYFFNPYIGAGASFGVSATRMNAAVEGGEEGYLQVTSYRVGPFFSYPLTARWLLGSKLLFGGAHVPHITLADQHIGARNGLVFTTGLSVAYRCREHYALRLFLDYNAARLTRHSDTGVLRSLTNGLSFEMTL